MGKGERARGLIRLAALVTVGLVAVVVPLLPADAAPTASRISGIDRYATSAAVSAASFAPGVPVAYVATGDNFPDALAGAPAAAKKGGPVLLTRPETLPAAVATELDRLNPGQIIALGGLSAVSTTVFDQLQQYTAGTVTRIQGGDRYATAAAISEATFLSPVNTVYVATGTNFPDALAGGPAVANHGEGGPMLLVFPGSIPGTTATELGRLAAQQIVVVGGNTGVSEAVKDQLEAYSVAPVVRRTGADRYHTSVSVSSGTFVTAPTVYLATGRNFPDALAGGSPAGVVGGPVLLTQPNCIPPEVNNEITRLNPSSLIVLGGEAAVSGAVLARQVCLPPTTTTTAPQQSCHPNYSPCLNPNSPDYDCAGGGGNGPDYVTGPVTIIGADPYGLDSDNDGVGCES